MKLKFEPDLDYQHAAIEAVCDLFAGQEVNRGTFTVSATTDDLLKAVAVLDTVYCSYDLAGILLIEYDRRSKTSLWQTYVSDLKERSSLSVQVLNIMDHPA